MIRKLLIPVVVVLFFATTSQADLITIGLDAPSPIVMDPGTVSGSVFVTIENNIASDAPEDFFEGWQMSLIIIPDSGANGTVLFNSPTTGIAPDPVDYVFASTTSLGINATNSGSTLFAFDLEFPTGPGVQVPLTPGFNLLEMDFAASSNALGTFRVFALGGPGQSEWTAADLSVRNFVNVPDDPGGMVEIGQVTVVPEPSSCFVVALGLMAILVNPNRRRASA